MTKNNTLDALRPGRFNRAISDPDALRQYQAEFSLNPLSPHNHSVFQIDEAALRPPTSQNSHWSVAWSDLMMTMFILFLSLFVYQAAHKEFLMDKKNEIIAGDTKDAVEIFTNSRASLPFPVIKPSAPLITSGTVKKVESIPLQDIDLDSTFSAAELDSIFNQQVASAGEKELSPEPEGGFDNPQKSTYPVVTETAATVVQPLPLDLSTTENSSVNSLFNQSRSTLDTFDLYDFASIDLVPDKAVRIVLTGDLLFETGHAALSLQAINSLEKIAEVIHDTQHQVHIEGHTDNIPITTGQYANNWELSLARANAVAVFLIKDMKMDPGKIVISGYSSYRPVVPNTSEENRALNRRVEIVISEAPVSDDVETFNSPISAYIPQ